jgi:cytochrome c553
MAQAWIAKNNDYGPGQSPEGEAFRDLDLNRGWSYAMICVACHAKNKSGCPHREQPLLWVLQSTTYRVITTFSVSVPDLAAYLRR